MNFFKSLFYASHGRFPCKDYSINMKLNRSGYYIFLRNITNWNLEEGVESNEKKAKIDFLQFFVSELQFLLKENLIQQINGLIII